MTEHVAAVEAAIRWAWTVRQLATVGISKQPRYPQPYVQPLPKTQ